MPDLQVCFANPRIIDSLAEVLEYLRRSTRGILPLTVSAVTEGPTFRLRRFNAAIGAEIEGLDLLQLLGDATIRAIRQALLESNGLVVFREQHITPEQHVAFSRRFGPLIIHVFQQYLLPGHPEILKISSIIENGAPIGLGDAGSNWHSDLSYAHEPSLGSLLYALELPTEGGDTSFANLTAAYDALPADIKQRLGDKHAVHSYNHSYERFSGSKFRPPLSQQQKDTVPEVVHPVVRNHPGRKSLL